MIARFLSFVALALLAPASVAQEAGKTIAPAPQPPQVELLTASVIRAYPHDETAFTQGLLWHEGWLYESTGRIGTSSVRKVSLETGEIAARRSIPATQFGEGLALWGEELISLTWLDGAVHRWRLKDLAPVRTTSDYPFEGWGLARFNEQLVTSDGSSVLRFLNPEDYSVERTVRVTFNGKPLVFLNELEVIDGLIFANVWKTDYIVVINPQTGVVAKLIDCRSLPKPTRGDPEAVLNGIAWDAESKRLFVTGKLWPALYEIELKPSGFLR